MPLTNLAGSFSDNLGRVPGLNAIGTSVSNTFGVDFSRIRKRFDTVNQNSVVGNGLTDIDDPTYLGFTLIFDITSPLFNGAIGGGNTSTVENMSSAVGYLEKVGELDRAKYLRAFIQGIREINANRPYYWQTVAGVDEAWKSLSAMGPDPYVGSKEGEGITIACLEAVDLKITALFTLYKLAVYDATYKRFVLPRNLMYFDVDVQVAEIRQFKRTINALSASSRGGRFNNNDSVAAADVVGNNSTFVTFKFTDCNWMAEESGKVFDSVSNAGGEVVSTSIKWSYSNIAIDAQFAGYEQSLLDSRQQNSGPLSNSDRRNKNRDQILQFARNQANQVSQQALTTAANIVEGAVVSQAQALLFGNVHDGVQNQIANILQNPGASVVNAIAGAAGGGISQGGTPPPVNFNIGSNIMPTPNVSKSLLLSEKIQPAARQPTNFDGEPVKSFPQTVVFGPAPSGPPPLQPTKVHG
jgi:hypothetical protein